MSESSLLLSNPITKVSSHTPGKISVSKQRKVALPTDDGDSVMDSSNMTLIRANCYASVYRPGAGGGRIPAVAE